MTTTKTKKHISCSPGAQSVPSAETNHPTCRMKSTSENALQDIVNALSRSQASRPARFIKLGPEDLWNPRELSTTALQDVDVALLRSASELDYLEVARNSCTASISQNSRPVRSETFLSIDGGFCDVCHRKISQVEFRDCVDVVGCAGGCRRYYHKKCVSNPQCSPWFCADCFLETAVCT